MERKTGKRNCLSTSKTLPCFLACLFALILSTEGKKALKNNENDFCKFFIATGQ